MYELNIVLGKNKPFLL